jgi:iron complex outermembrane receptor protein
VHPDDNWVWGAGSRKYGTALANAEYALGTDVHAYGWFNYAHKSGSNYVNPERLVKTNNNPSAAVLASAGPTTPTLLNQYDDPWRSPDGYQPDLTYIATDIDEVAGVRLGNVDKGKWDLALSEGRNNTSRYVDGTYNPSWGPASPSSGYLGSWVSNTTSLTADYLKAQPVPWLEQPLLINGGLLARHENWGVGDVGAAWTYTPGALATSYRTVGSLYRHNPDFLPAGLTAGEIAAIASDKSLLPTVADLAGIQPVDVKSAKRDVAGLYLGAEADLTNRIQAAATGRYEHYSDFGNTVDGKLTGRFDVTPQAAVRSTLSTGFHAPSLAELAYQATGITGTLVNGGGTSAQVPGYTRQFAPNDPLAAAFGARPLEPEKSVTFSLGTVLRPTASSSLTADAYYLKIRDAITTSGSLSGNGKGPAPASGTVVGNAFAAEGFTGFTTASYYLNAWDQSTRGLELTGRQRLEPVGHGTLDLTAELSLIDTTVNPNTVHATANIGTSIFTAIAPAQIRDVEYGTPRNKLILDARYAIGRWVADGTFTRFGQYRYDANGTNGIADQVFQPETYVDLGFTYRATDRARLELGAQNLLNRYPDPYNIGNRQSGVNKYSFIAPNGSAGRFVYAGVNYTLD